MATSAVPLPSPRVRAREERTKKEDEGGDGAATPRYIKISGDGGRLNKRLRESSKTRRGEGKRETVVSTWNEKWPARGYIGFYGARKKCHRHRNEPRPAIILLVRSYGGPRKSIVLRAQLLIIIITLYIYFVVLYLESNGIRKYFDKRSIAISFVI